MERLPTELWERIFGHCSARELKALEETRLPLFAEAIGRHCRRSRRSLVLPDDVGSAAGLAWVRARFPPISCLRLRLREELDLDEEGVFRQRKLCWDLLSGSGVASGVTSIVVEDPDGLFYDGGFAQWTGALDGLVLSHFSLLGAPLPAHASDLSIFLTNQRASLRHFTATVKCEALYELLGQLLECSALETIQLFVWGAYPINWAYNVGIHEVSSRGLKELRIHFVDRPDLAHLDKRQLRRLVARCPGLHCLHITQPLCPASLGLVGNLSSLESFSCVLRPASVPSFVRLAPRLSSLSLSVPSAAMDVLRSLGSVPWPRLRRLGLFFGEAEELAGLPPLLRALAALCPRLEQLESDQSLKVEYICGRFPFEIRRREWNAEVPHQAPKASPVGQRKAVDWLSSCYGFEGLAA